MIRSNTRGLLYTTPPAEGEEWPDNEQPPEPPTAEVHEEPAPESTTQQPTPADD